MKRKSIWKWIRLVGLNIFAIGYVTTQQLPAIKDLPISINDSIIGISFNQADYLSKQQYRYAEQVIIRGVVEQQLSHCDSVVVAQKKLMDTYSYLNKEFVLQQGAYNQRISGLKIALDISDSEIRKQKTWKIVAWIAGGLVGVHSDTQ